MSGGRQVAETAVGQLDEERRLHRAPLAELQPNLSERLVGHRADADGADSQHLERHRHRCLSPDHAHRALGVIVRQIELARLGGRFGQSLLGPGDLLGGRLVTHDHRLPIAGRQRHSVLILDLGQGRLYLGCQVVGHKPHLLVRFLRWSWVQEVDVVHVAAGAVGHQSHHRGILLVAVQKTFQPLAIHAVVVGRDVARPHTSHVVQRIGREHGDRPSAGLAHGQDRHGRIGRPGWFDQVRAASPRVHFHLVNAAERIGRHRARLEEPAAVEHVLRRMSTLMHPSWAGRSRFTAHRTPSAIRRTTKLW